MKMSLVLIAASALAVPMAPALAQGQSMNVPYADLNLATPAGRAALDKRIEAAARKVCAVDEVRVGTRIRDGSARKCVADVDRQVRAQIAAITGDETLGG